MGCSAWTHKEVDMTEHTHCRPHGRDSIAGLPPKPASHPGPGPANREELPAHPSDKVMTGALT